MVYLEHLDRLSIKYFLNHSIKPHTTLKVGGKALIYIVPNTFRQLQQSIVILKENGVKYKILGNGSNVLVSDSGYNGAIISTKELDNIKFAENSVVATCGVKLCNLIKQCKNQGLSGLESLCGIPATVGGAIVMNAGAFNSCISDKLISVYALYEDKPVIIDKQNCSFSYRKSKFLNSKYTILSATFSLDFKPTLEIENNIKSFIKMRRERQPVSRSCGSVFKNTSLAPSGLLIEKCGLKGFSLGNASVSNVHANFINLKDGCTAKEVYELIKAVKNKVKEKFNITLHEEVEFLGDFKWRF